MEWLWDLLVNLHWGAVGQIIMIDILLGGDNAVVIALACRQSAARTAPEGRVLGYVRRDCAARDPHHVCRHAARSAFPKDGGCGASRVDRCQAFGA